MKNSKPQILNEKDLEQVVGGVITYPEGAVEWRNGNPWRYVNGRWVAMIPGNPGKPDDKE